MPLQNTGGLLRGAGRVLAIALLLSTIFCSAAHANTSLFFNTGTACTSTVFCTALSDFGVLTGVGDSFSSNGGMTLNGGIGVQSGGVMTLSGGNTTSNDIVDFSDAITRNTTCGTANLCGAGTLNSASVTATNKPQQDAALLSRANTQLTNIESYLSGLKNSATAMAAAPTTGTNNIETSATSLGSNVYVYRTNGTSNYATSGTLTFNCGGGGTGPTKCSDDILIVILGTSGSVTFQNNITLGDGLTSDQVIFYVPTANTTFLNGGTNNSTLTMNGAFFFNNAQSAQQVALAGASNRNLVLNGRLYGGNFVDNNSGTFTQNDLGEMSPEPGTWALFIGGFGAMIWIHRRRRAA